MKKVATIISSVVAAFFVAVVLLLCLERVPVGYVGVVYSARYNLMHYLQYLYFRQ